MKTCMSSSKRFKFGVGVVVAALVICFFVHFNMMETGYTKLVHQFSLNEEQHALRATEQGNKESVEKAESVEEATAENEEAAVAAENSAAETADKEAIVTESNEKK